MSALLPKADIVKNLQREKIRESVEKRFYVAIPQAMRAPPPPKGAGWSE
jgi:hypothetical protein